MIVSKRGFDLRISERDGGGSEVSVVLAMRPNPEMLAVQG